MTSSRSTKHPSSSCHLFRKCCASAAMLLGTAVDDPISLSPTRVAAYKSWHIQLIRPNAASAPGAAFTRALDVRNHVSDRTNHRSRVRAFPSQSFQEVCVFVGIWAPATETPSHPSNIGSPKKDAAAVLSWRRRIPASIERSREFEVRRLYAILPSYSLPTMRAWRSRSVVTSFRSICGWGPP